MTPKLNPIVKSIPEALSIYINQIVYDKKSRGERVYTYSLGEAFFDIPRFQISDSDWTRGYHYSSSMGQGLLRQKLADLYGKYGAKINPDTEVLISAGSKILIYMVLLAIIDEGDEVLVPEPAWLSYKEQIKLANGVHVPVPYTETVDNWEKYITPRTKAIIINNPTNPSGKLFSHDEFNTLLEMARQHNLFIISDEAYSDFLTPNKQFISFASIDKNHDNSIIVNSLSKNMGMSGWRVGYAVAHENVIHELLKLNQHLVTCAPTVLQDYMAEHFEEILSFTRPQAVKMAEKRHAVQQIMDKLGIKTLSGVGTFYFLIDVSSFPGSTDELVYDLLINHNIATVSGIAYGESTRDFIRFGIGVENLKDIESSLKTIKSFLEISTYDNSEIINKMKEMGLV